MKFMKALKNDLSLQKESTIPHYRDLPITPLSSTEQAFLSIHLMLSKATGAGTGQAHLNEAQCSLLTKKKKANQSNSTPSTGGVAISNALSPQEKSLCMGPGSSAQVCFCSSFPLTV